MKKHFISLFEPDKRRKTIILLVIAALFISVSIIIGTADNLPMIAMLIAGLILLYFGILHPWRKASRFAILTAIFIVMIVLDFIWPFISEDIAMSVGLACLAGIIAGIIGIFTRINGWRRLPFAASLLSLLALGIISTNLDNPSFEQIAPVTEWILIIGAQIFITILLFSIGLINKKERWLTKALLIVVSILLTLLVIWGLYTSSRDFGEAVNSKAFATLMFRIFASVEIIIAGLSLYACK
jgi:MFS family permease